MTSMIYVIDDFNDFSFKNTTSIKENASISWNSKIKDQKKIFTLFMLCIITLAIAAITMIIISLICII